MHIWIYLLLDAVHMETEILIGRQVIILQPGQIVTNRMTIAAKTGIQESKVERILKKLVSEQQIEQQKFTKYRIISIVNWLPYQQSEQQSEQQIQNVQKSGLKGQIEQQSEQRSEQQKFAKNSIIPIINIDACSQSEQQSEQQNNAMQTTKCFDVFWAAYPRKTGKEIARQSWKRLADPVATLDLILKALAWQTVSADWNKDNGQFIPMPSTYLNQGRWQDEPFQRHSITQLNYNSKTLQRNALNAQAALEFGEGK